LLKSAATNGVSYVPAPGATPDPQWQMTLSNAGVLVSFTRSVYDLDSRVQYAVDARGTVTQYQYDAAGRRTSSLVYTNYTVSLTSTNATVQPPAGYATQTSYVYDNNGNQVAVVDALGRETDYTYDPGNRLTSTTFPLVSGDLQRKQQSTVYDGLGRRLQEQDEAGVVTAYTYDFRGLLKTVSLDANSPPTARRRSLPTILTTRAETCSRSRMPTAIRRHSSMTPSAAARCARCRTIRGKRRCTRTCRRSAARPPTCSARR
jgi:YD repeat-containing protein